MAGSIFLIGYLMGKLYAAGDDASFKTVSVVFFAMVSMFGYALVRWIFTDKDADYPNKPSVACADNKHHWDISRRRIVAETGRAYVWCSKCGQRKAY